MDEKLETIELELTDKMIDFIYSNEKDWIVGDLPDSSQDDYFLWLGENGKLYLTKEKTKETICVKYLKRTFNFENLFKEQK